MNNDLAEKILDLAARRADAAEVYLEQGECTSIQFENNRLKYVTTKQMTGVGVRVIHGGRIGFSSTTDLSDPEGIVARAVESAAFGQRAAFAFPAAGPLPSPAIHDPAVRDYPPEEAIGRCREAIARLLDYDAHLDCAAGADMSWGTTTLANSSGLRLTAESTLFDIGLHALRVDEDGTLTSVSEGQEKRRLEPDLSRHVKKAICRLELARRTARLKPATLPVVFAPSALGVLLASLLANVNGKARQKGTSLLLGREGERVLDARVALWSDPLVDFGPASAAFDGEGLPCRRVALFEEGVFTQFLYDLQTAGLLGTAPTGSAVRGFSSQPTPGPGNVRLAPGEASWPDLLSDIGRGLYVCHVLGGGQSNVLAGEFSVNVELGFLVEGGEIVGRVKDVMVAGNAFDAFNRVAAISRQTEWHGAAELPFVCFDGLSIVGSQT